MYVAIYSRVSTNRQINKGFGLDIQRNELINEAKNLNVEYKEYFDSGFTGTSIKDRKALEGMLRDVEEGLISEVWVTKLSRLGRNTRDVLNIIHILERNNIKFRSIRDGIDTSNQMGKIMLQFMSIVSEMERDIIMETTKAGLDFRASLGKIYGCGKVLGYDRRGGGKNSYIEVNIDEAKIIKDIFNRYLKGDGYKAITNHLNYKGLKTTKGNYFSINTVKNILSNPLYAGYIRYNLFKDWSKKRRKGLQNEKDIILVDGLHDSIISKNKWKRTQKRMKRYQKTNKVLSSEYLLVSSLRCPDCGSLMVGVKGKYKYKDTNSIYRRYNCSNYHNKGKSVCNINSVRVELIDNKVLDIIKNYLLLEPRYNKDSWFIKIKEIINSSDNLKIKKFLKVFIRKVLFDKHSKDVTLIELNIEEDLLVYLEEKYTNKKIKRLKNAFTEFEA